MGTNNSKKPIYHFFGEVAYYHDGEEDEARKYLNLWKKYKLRMLEPDLEFIEEQYVEKDLKQTSPFIIPNFERSLGIKICMKGLIDD